MREGSKEATGALTRPCGRPERDASLLALRLRKVSPVGEPQMRSTVDRVVDQLAQDGCLHRYRSEADDGLPGGEGVFLMCSFWLVDCYAELGRLPEARELFERLIKYANDVGLFAEELDPRNGRHLGNFPQAFTHVALINAAVSLAEAEAKSFQAAPVE